MASDHVVYRQNKMHRNKKRRASVVIIKDIFESAKKYSNKSLPKLAEITEEYSTATIMRNKIRFQRNENLLEVLKTRSSLLRFRRFLKTEFSEENLDFWLECEAYKRRKESKFKKYAEIICQKYIMFGAPREVNLDGDVKQEILNKVAESPNRSCFEIAQSQIFYLMESDSFQRFPQKQHKMQHEQMIFKDQKTPFIKHIFNNGRRRLSI